MKDKISLEDYIDTIRFMGDKKTSVEELEEQWNLLYNTDCGDSEEKNTYSSLKEFIKDRFEEFSPGLFFSREEKENGFAFTDLSHYSIEDIEEEFKNWNNER